MSVTPNPTKAKSIARNSSEKNMLGQNCTIKDHRPCELDTGVAFAKDISSEAKVPLTPRLKAVIESGQGTETQIQAALNEWRYSIPNERREEADWLYNHVFPGRAGR